MTQPSGWYDDPQDPSQLRYWDGVSWSSHVTPKVSPTVQDSTIGMPYGVAPAAERPQGPGSHGSRGAPAAPGEYGPAQRWPQGGPMPAYGQPLGWQSNQATTPDGVVLSGWWKRVLAQIIDNIVVSIVALPLTFAPMKQAVNVLQDYFQQVANAVNAGSSTMPTLPDSLSGPILQISVTVLILNLVYEIAFLTRTGATPGKRVAGISVRLRDKPGPPTLDVVLKRTAVKQGGDVVGLVRVLGFFGSLFRTVDVLWPLWDVKKQAIHDKAASTNVVVGPQPRRDA